MAVISDDFKHGGVTLEFSEMDDETLLHWTGVDQDAQREYVRRFLSDELPPGVFDARHLPGKHNQKTHGHGHGGEPARLNSVEEIHAFLGRQGIATDQSSVTDPEERLALKGYTDGGAGYFADDGSSPGYRGLNGYLRDPAAFKGAGAESAIKEAVPRLDRAIARNKLKESVVVSRVVGSEAFGAQAYDVGEGPSALLGSAIKPGDVLQDPAYLSTSLRSNIEVGRDYWVDAHPDGVPVKMQITVPSGTSVAYAEPFNPYSSPTGTAQELLLGRGTKLRIDSVKDDFADELEFGGVEWTVHATVLP